MLENYRDKAEMYITSLWLLFILIIVLTVDVPLEFSESSYFIGFKELTSRNIIPIISLFFLFIGLFYVLRFRYKLKGSNNSYFRIKKIRNKNYEHLTFLTTYIIPLICLDLSDLRYIIVLMFLLVIIGIIYIKTDMFYANPTLALLGYQLYEADAELRDGLKEQIILISREKIDEQSNVVYKKLDEKIYFIRRRR
ncbi:anti-phage protein KwaA [Desulforamulus aquiferis]|uniref:Uncharacterized protein n=1 Tax=Desulforamulus aquiferis TaxID=1397668 RepID=A0AAW7Z950_9FIRM|nr:anti-phage protein KwaA [Desulforamulus aquiferis]MDO7786065.1 hypothetical protein [Desulforamulus aquiferis]